MLLRLRFVLPHHASSVESSSSPSPPLPFPSLSLSLSLSLLSRFQIGEARLSQDEEITTRFVHPFQKTLSTSIAIAVRARNSVKQARLELDSARQILKNAGVGPKGEQARLDVENAEDKLVQAVSSYDEEWRRGNGEADSFARSFVALIPFRPRSLSDR